MRIAHNLRLFILRIHSSIIVDVIGRTRGVIERFDAKLPKAFRSKPFETVTKRLQKAAKQLEAMPRG
jgi:hypothetical protein